MASTGFIARKQNISKRLRNHSTENSKRNPVQQDKSLNGDPVGSSRKAEEPESSDVANSDHAIDVDNRENSHTKEGNKKRKKKKHTDEKTEKEQDEHKDEVVNVKEKKEGKKKRKSSRDNSGHVELSLGKGVTDSESKSEPKRKKKKKSLVDNDNKTTITKTADSVHENGVEESVSSNGDNKDLNSEHKSDKGIIKSSSEDNISALIGDVRLTAENGDQKLTSAVESKVLHKATSHDNEPFAKFQTNSTPPAFVRRCLAKTPSTEPRKNKTNDMKVQPPGSAPTKGTRKRVRIEMSKNTSHTTQDYQRSVKESPIIPFDAEKTPTQGLLKSPPRPQRTPLVVKKNASASTDPGRRQRKKKQAETSQRPRAFDFF